MIPKAKEADQLEDATLNIGQRDPLAWTNHFVMRDITERSRQAASPCMTAQPTLIRRSLDTVESGAVRRCKLPARKMRLDETRYLRTTEPGESEGRTEA
jgi:hypothetical protein